MGAKKAVQSHVLICITIPLGFLDCDCISTTVLGFVVEFLAELLIESTLLILAHKYKMY